MARIKPHGREVVYHCVSRVVGGQFLLGDLEKETFRRLMRAQAEFCGVDIVAYCLMSNHVHLLVRVPIEVQLDDSSILKRVLSFYGSRHALTKALQSLLKKGEAIPGELRKRLLLRMGDISIFNKELKQRFSAWYNCQNDRFGTLWAERFRSTVVEGVAETMLVVAAYIDLNPVRAGIVSDPKDYRFCGYAEALVGSSESRAGIMGFHPRGSWRDVSVLYREYLFVKGGVSGSSKKLAMERTAILTEIERGARLSEGQLLRLKIRYFTDGVVIGSSGFVNEVFLEFRSRFSKNRSLGARPLNTSLKALGLTSLRDLRFRPFG